MKISTKIIAGVVAWQEVGYSPPRVSLSCYSGHQKLLYPEFSRPLWDEMFNNNRKSIGGERLLKNFLWRILHPSRSTPNSALYFACSMRELSHFTASNTSRHYSVTCSRSIAQPENVSAILGYLLLWALGRSFCPEMNFAQPIDNKSVINYNTSIPIRRVWSSVKEVKALCHSSVRSSWRQVRHRYEGSWNFPVVYLRLRLGKAVF